MYSISNPPQWSKKKSEAVQKVAVETFNEEFKRSGNESKSRRASLAAMANAEEAFKKYSSVNKSFILKKSTNEELMQATFVVMVPDEVDLHGDVISEEEVRKACHNFNKFCRKPNLMHIYKTDSFEFAESYILPCDAEIEGKQIKKGSWLTTIQCNDTDIWNMIKSGDICSVSIGAIAKVENIYE